MKIYEVIGETTAGAIATVASPLGGGDPSASVYSKKKKSKKSQLKLLNQLKSHTSQN